jgi:hypothetical protein
MLMLVLDPSSPREAEPFTRITRHRAVRSLPLAPSSVALIASRQCAAFIEKSELTTGGSLPLTFLPPIPIRTLIPYPLIGPPLPAPRSIHPSPFTDLAVIAPGSSLLVRHRHDSVLHGRQPRKQAD